MALGDLTININSDNSRAKKGFDDLREHAKGFMYSISKFGGVGSGPAALLGLSGPAAMAAEIGATVGVAIAALKSLAQAKKEAESADISVEGYIKLKDAVVGTNTEMMSMLQMVRKASFNVNEAANGNEDMAKSFDRLGLNISKLMSMNTEERFLAIAEAISNTKKSSDAMAMSMKLLGEEAGKSLPAIQNIGLKKQNTGMVESVVKDFEKKGIDAAKKSSDIMDAMWAGAKTGGTAGLGALAEKFSSIVAATEMSALWLREFPQEMMNAATALSVPEGAMRERLASSMQEKTAWLAIVERLGYLTGQIEEKDIGKTYGSEARTVAPLQGGMSAMEKEQKNKSYLEFMDKYKKAIGEEITEEEKQKKMIEDLAKGFMRLGIIRKDQLEGKKAEIAADIEAADLRKARKKSDEEQTKERSKIVDDFYKNQKDRDLEINIKLGNISETDAKLQKLRNEMTEKQFNDDSIDRFVGALKKQLQLQDFIANNLEFEKDENEKIKAVKEAELALEREIIDTKLEEAVLQGRITEQQVQAYRAMRGLMDKGMSAKDAEQAVMPLFGKLNSLKQEKINQEIIKGVAEVKEETEKLEAEKEKRITEIKREAMVKRGQMTEEQAKLEAEKAEWLEKKWGKMDKATQDMLLDIYKSEKDTGVSKARGDMSTISDSMLRYGAYMGRTAMGGNDPAVASLKKIEAYNAKMVSWASRFSLGLRSN